MKRPGFNAVIWLGTLLVVAYLIGGPTAMDAWAYFTWVETPCHYVKADDRYYYQVGSIKRDSTRRDFWQLKFDNNSVAAGMPDFEPNATCWVNRRDPQQAVQFLDAHKNWTNSLGRVGASALLMVAVWLITVFGLRQRTTARPGAAPSPASPSGPERSGG